MHQKPSPKILLSAAAGTVFEWYDFFIYSSLAIFFSKVFFPANNDLASFLIVLATLGVGLIVRPIGAMLFGRFGDLVGRKKTFMATIVLMGAATTAIGLVPGFSTIGWFAPIAIVILRICQGLALGGEYGGSITYISEHTSKKNRGFYSSMIQSTVVIGFILTFVVVLLTKQFIEPKAFAEWGWRIPFLLSSVLLVASVYIRKQLSESPEFDELVKTNQRSTSPLSDVVTDSSNRKWALILLAILAGQGVVSYITQVNVIFFLTSVLSVDVEVAFTMIMISLILSVPIMIFLGWLSDKIGRIKIILFGFVVTITTIYPLYHGLTHFANPELETAQRTISVVINSTNECQINLIMPQTTECARVKEFFAKKGVMYSNDVGSDMVFINGKAVQMNVAVVKEKLYEAGYPVTANIELVNKPVVILLLTILLSYMSMCYAPIGALMAEAFPTKVRFSATSTVSAIGNGWFGGMLPLIVMIITSLSGNIYYGLWYPIAVICIAVAVCINYWTDLE